MIDVKLSTRSAYRAATTCAIMPPIDKPTTCARGTQNASSRPTVSAAMSSILYGARTGKRSHEAASAAGRLGCLRTWIFDDRAQSRLSKRITRKPRSTNPRQNASGHAMSCMPRPMSRIGGASDSPNRFVFDRDAVGCDGGHARNRLPATTNFAHRLRPNLPTPRSYPRRHAITIGRPLILGSDITAHLVRTWITTPRCTCFGLSRPRHEWRALVLRPNQNYPDSG